MTKDDIIKFGKSVIKSENDALIQLIDYISDDFYNAVIECRRSSTIIVTGVGKNIFIAQKMSATLSSIGIKSIFVHPNDANHGDFGKISNNDCVVVLSYSGETNEVLSFCEIIKLIRTCKIISITKNRNSSIGKLSDISLCVGDFSEAGHIKMVPTSSTTVTLAMCDALSVCIGFDKGINDFKENHPGGNIGIKLANVNKFMRHEFPLVNKITKIKDVLFEMTKFGSGMALVCDNDKLIAVLTDGDIRRLMMNGNALENDVELHMNKNYVAIIQSTFLEDALQIFKDKSIGDIPVVDENSKPVGLLNLKDITRFVL
jgi:arabinose-5-phosphate isomerase